MMKIILTLILIASPSFANQSCFMLFNQRAVDTSLLEILDLKRRIYSSNFQESLVAKNLYNTKKSEALKVMSESQFQERLRYLSKESGIPNVEVKPEYSRRVGEILEIEGILGVPIHGKDANGDTSLHIAAHLGRVDIMSFLLKEGVDINAVNKFGIPPISKTIRFESTEAFNFLRERGADLMLADERAIPPLVFALKSGSDQIFEVLYPEALEHLARLSEKALNVNPPEAYHLHEDIAKAMLYRRSSSKRRNEILTDLEAINKNLSGPLSVGEINQILFFVHRGTSEDLQNKNNLAYRAIKDKNVNVLSALLKTGEVNVNHPFANDSLLLQAISAQSIDMVRLLIQAGADLNAVTYIQAPRGEYTPLAWASLSGSWNKDKADIAKLIVDSGADLSSKNLMYSYVYAPEIKSYIREARKNRRRQNSIIYKAYSKSRDKIKNLVQEIRGN